MAKTKKNYKGLPDHISVELEFLSELTKRESESWEKADLQQVISALEHQQEFYERHLGKWFKSFCLKVETSSKMALYAGAAKLASEFIESEIEDVAERLKAAQGECKTRAGGAGA